ncbi:MAG: O-antigen ligase domain-containing protein [Burkholderiaceae bacterium]|nr:MAG: O-antigen ligase domain-containing protein [Burkholderiaceae bacterium]
MKGSVRPASSEAGFYFLGFVVLAAMLIFAPIMMGGNRPLPVMLLQIGAIVLLFLWLSRPRSPQPLSRPLLFLVGALVALPLLQLLPLPEFASGWLPGRDLYAASSAAVGGTPDSRTWSLIPYITESAFLTLLVPVAVFLVTTATGEVQLTRLVNLFVGLALIQAIIGLAQFGTGSLTVLPGLEGVGVSAAYGTYANPDHLAGLLEMALPVALGLLVASVHAGGPATAHARRQVPLRQRISRMLASGMRFNRVAMHGAAALAILMGLIFSHSRTGVALAMLGILVCALVFSRWAGGQRSSRLVAAFAIIAVALALEIGLTSVFSRFTTKGVTDDLRWSIFAGTIQGIREFFPFGSGFGTFPAIFRRFQPGDVPEFVNHAHNDYLEWLFEGGLPMAIVMLGFLLLYLLRWPKVWPRGDHCAQYDYMRMSAGIGLLMLGLHGALDFNLHIPANAVYFAFLAGVFFHPKPVGKSAHSVHAPAPTRTPAPVFMPGPLAHGPQTPEPAPGAEVRNPFSDP